VRSTRPSSDRHPRRRGYSVRWKPAATLRLAVGAYGVVLAALTLVPIQWDPWRASYPNDDYSPELMPLRGSGTNPFKSSHPVHMLAEQVGNILLFCPLGLMAPLLWPRMNRLWRVMALGAMISLGIELAQVPMSGIHRADVNDVILNSLGSGLGWLALRVGQRVAAHRTTRS
jgi:glycopeptide antibiotics resistance protein